MSTKNIPKGTQAGTFAAGDDPRLLAVSGHSDALNLLTIIPTNIKTVGYNAMPQDLVLADASGGSFTVTLPSAPSDATLIEVKKLDASNNAIVVTANGVDTFSSGGTNVSLVLQGQGVMWRYRSNGNVWIALNNDLPFTAVESRYLTQLNAANTYATKLSPSFTGTVTVPSPVSSAAATNKAYVDSVQTSLTGINTQTVNYTFVSTDAGKQVEYVSSSSGTFIIPTNQSTPMSVGTIIQLYLGGNGPLTIAAANGVSLVSPSGFRMTVQYATATLIQRAVDSWVLSGYVVV